MGRFPATLKSLTGALRPACSHAANQRKSAIMRLVRQRRPESIGAIDIAERVGSIRVDIYCYLRIPLHRLDDFTNSIRRGGVILFSDMQQRRARNQRRIREEVLDVGALIGNREIDIAVRRGEIRHVSAEAEARCANPAITFGQAA